MAKSKGKDGKWYHGYRGEGFREGFRDAAGGGAKSPYLAKCACGQHKEYLRGAAAYKGRKRNPGR